MKELPLISVKEARKILGKQSEEMDDAQVMLVIRFLTDAADNYLQSIYVKKSNNSLG